MDLKVLILILAVITLVMGFLSLRVRRPNYGYVFLALLVFFCDVACFILLGCKGAEKARGALTFYYICFPWMYFGFLWFVEAMDRYRKAKAFLIPAGILCLYQSVIIAGGLFGTKVLFVSRHILLGVSWWVVSKGTIYGHVFDLDAYRFITVVVSASIVIRAILAVRNSAQIFRVKYYILLGLDILLGIFEFFTVRNSLPVWVGGIVVSLAFVSIFHLVNFFSTNRLRDWSLAAFANEMSDGFILFDEYDDLIHMNDLLKRAIPEELIESFRDRTNLDGWLSDTTEIEKIEAKVCEKDGEVTYFKTRKNDLGEGMGTIYILHDTTDTILKLQAMKEANLELERTARMKSDFLANMSHEIRTPMNAVIGMAELALREELPDKVTDYLDQIQNSGKNLLNIINDILDFSKIEAGRMDIIPEEYELVTEINDVANVLVTRIGEKKLELFIATDPDIPAKLYGDIMRIRQILINLANNAIKFTKEGIVEIRISSEYISRDEVNITFHVIDTGQGIKEEDLEKLFVSFSQVDSKRNRSVEGTGLGLAISQRLCEAMRGSIGVESEYGKGSDFYFTVPQKVIDPTPAMLVMDADKKHIFCIDDKPDMLKLFEMDANKLDIGFTVISSAEEYVPTGKRDYVFFQQETYDDSVKKLLDDHAELNGVIAVDYDTDFVPDRKNLRLLRRPSYTATLVLIMNDKDAQPRSIAADEAFVFDFTAPDARILIVDDNEINITIAQGLLEPLKVQSASALSGSEAIDLVKAQDFDIVFMDHMMPEMDGVEATKLIRETIPKAKDMPIIALSANVIEEARELFRQAGMTDFVAKPIDVRKMISKVKEYLPPEKIIEGAGDDDASGSGMSEFDCLNTKEAIRSLGSPALYQKIVAEYYRAGWDKYRVIMQAYESEDWETYIINTHSLKSSSRQVGAFELGDKAEEMEKAGKAGNTSLIRSKTLPMLDDFEKLLKKLEQYFPEEEAAEDLPLISEEELSEILTELTASCEELDFDGMEAAKEKLAGFSFPEEIKEDIAYLNSAIENIDIDGCGEIVERLRV